MSDQSMPYDLSTRRLVERDPASLVSYLLGRPIARDRLRRAPTELTGRSVRLDSVFELDEPSLVLQVEFERNARADRLHPRLVTYFERLLTRYGEAPEQYVVVLERSNGRLPGVYRVGGLRLRYHTVHLWDVDPDPLLADPGLSPLAVLADLGDAPDALARVTNVLDRIGGVSDPELRRQLAVDTAFYARLVLDPTTLVELLRRYPAMPIYIEEHPFFQDGLERGLEQGLEQGEARVLARIFQHRFPDLASDDVARISGLDRDHSDRLAEFVVELASADELHNWLDANP